MNTVKLEKEVAIGRVVTVDTNEKRALITITNEPFLQMVRRADQRYRAFCEQQYARFLQKQKQQDKPHKVNWQAEGF